jgi:hypothetical protein
MKKKFLISLIVTIGVFILLFVSSNTFKVKTIEEIQKIIENTDYENSINEKLPLINYSNSKTINEIKYEIIPQPAQKRLKLLFSEDAISKEDINESNKLICYELKITNNDINVLKKMYLNDYDIKYFSNDMRNDIALIVSNDTLNCTLFHFERTYGVVPYLSFQLGFAYSKSWKNKPHHLVFKDTYFENGEIHLVSTYK